MDKTKPFFAILLGDSLSLPRHKSSISIEDTYFYRIGKWWQERYGQTVFWPLSKGGATISHLTSNFYSFLPYLGPKRIDVAIVQLGVVDCAPRPLPYRVRTWLTRVPKNIRSRIVRLLHRNRRKLLKAGMSFRFTNPKKFRIIYSDLLKRLSVESSRVYVTNIAPATEITYQHSYGLKESIVNYNKIIDEVASTILGVKVIDIYNELQESSKVGAAEDIHMSKEGHDIIFHKVCEYEEQIWQEQQIK
ncbi:MAG: SGNH/GDSL hydrolase family protein [Candidatus Aureabacteria bacterium]|nr:SGNH/GDSL hydrolase family protein [Candidatus Auribacterota bacterium]